MKRFLPVAILTCAMALPQLSAETLTFIDANGSNVTSVVIRDGARVTLGEATYTFQLEGDKTEETQRRLDTIMFPKVSFKNASLDEVLDYYRTQAAMRDLTNKGVNILTVVPETEKLPRVNLELSRISLAKLLEYTTRITGTEFEIDESGTILISREGEGRKSSGASSAAPVRRRPVPAPAPKAAPVRAPAQVRTSKPVPKRPQPFVAPAKAPVQAPIASKPVAPVIKPVRVQPVPPAKAAVPGVIRSLPKAVPNQLGPTPPPPAS